MCLITAWFHSHNTLRRLLLPGFTSRLHGHFMVWCCHDPHYSCCSCCYCYSLLLFPVFFLVFWLCFVPWFLHFGFCLHCVGVCWLADLCLLYIYCLWFCICVFVLSIYNYIAVASCSRLFPMISCLHFVLCCVVLFFFFTLWTKLIEIFFY